MRKKRTISGRNRIAIVSGRRLLPPRSENRSSSARAAYDSEANSPSSPRTVGMAPRARRTRPSDEERQRRREDQQDPGRREQRAPLEIEADRQRVGEGDGEGGQRHGEEKSRDESTRTPSRP